MRSLTIVIIINRMFRPDRLNKEIRAADVYEKMNIGIPGQECKTEAALMMTTSVSISI